MLSILIQGLTAERIGTRMEHKVMVDLAWDGYGDVIWWETLNVCWSDEVREWVYDRYRVRIRSR
jgi:hypothetical protein